MKEHSRMLKPRGTEWWLTVVISLCLAAAGCNMQPNLHPGDLVAFTKQLDEQMPKKLQQYGVPGAAVALVQDGEVVWTRGYGLANVELKTPVTTDTVFQVASISKTLTSWGIMRLVQKGKLNLDAPVEQYLTRWHLPPSKFAANGVTIRRLLSHSAGISVHGYPGTSPEQSLPTLEESLSGKYDETREVQIMMEPGTQYSYSGGGYTLLQLVIEEVSGESFSSYMEHEVLEPLGMKQSSFEWRADLKPATATGYDPSRQPYPNYLFTEKAAAGLYTTAPDLARFVAAEMSGPDGGPAGRGILTPETLKLMLTSNIQLPGMEGKFFGISMGLGHFIENLKDGIKAISHRGANRGWQLTFMSIPERGEGIVILTNSDQGTDIGTDVLSAWGVWLGAGVPGMARFYQAVRSIVLGLAGLLGLGLLIRIRGLVRQIRDGRRQWIWRISGKPVTRSYIGLALSVLLSAMIAVLWWLAAQPIISGLAYSQAGWLTLAVLGWCLFSAVFALLRPIKA